MKNLLLIQPKPRLKYNYSFAFPPMSLIYLASYTPPQFHVKIVNEFNRKVKIKDLEQADLIGITVTVTTANRAYDIAEQCKELGKKVILGGAHVSVMPKEAEKHADSIVIGEADLIWEKILSDFKSNKLKKRYVVKCRPDLSKLKPPDREKYLNTKNYIFPNIIQTSRGCPHRCNYCLVHKLNGNTMRHRFISSIIKEIKSSKSRFRRIIAFSDDNIVADKEYAKELFKALIPLRVRWFSQSSIDIARDEELLELAYKSGCRMLNIGFESIRQEDLKYYNKPSLVKDYSKLMKRIKKYKIYVWGNFMFGSDQCVSADFERTVKFCLKNNMDFVWFNLLTPLPGTSFFEKMKKENRILTYNWDHYNGFYNVLDRKNINNNIIQKLLLKSYREFYSLANIMKRTCKNLLGYGFMYSLIFLIFNFKMKSFKFIPPTPHYLIRIAYP